MTLRPNPERLSLMLGLMVLMSATMPRFLMGGHSTRLTLMGMTLAAVAAVAVVHWRLLDAAQRRRLPRLLKRLVLCGLVGLAGMGLWNLLVQGGLPHWWLLSGQGATLMLLLHALWLWWAPLPDTDTA